jgi:hypothetical protein
VWLVAILCGAATIASGRVAAQDVVIDRDASLDVPFSFAGVFSAARESDVSLTMGW